MKCGGRSQREPRSRRGLEAPDSLGRKSALVQHLILNMVALTKIYPGSGVCVKHSPLNKLDRGSTNPWAALFLAFIYYTMVPGV